MNFLGAKLAELPEELAFELLARKAVMRRHITEYRCESASLQRPMVRYRDVMRAAALR